MGFNAGAFAGALGNTALNTYTRLNEDARQNQKAQQEAEQFEAWRTEQQQTKDNAAIYADTLANPATTQRQTVPGTVGQSALPDGQQGPTAQMQDVPYSDSQKFADYRQRTALAGIDPIKALQVSGAARSDKSAQKMSEFQDWATRSQDLLSTPEGRVIWANENMGAYNKPKKGDPLDDGYTAEVVKGADGSHSLIQRDKNGKNIAATPITPESAQAAFEKVAFAKYKSLDFKGGMELDIKRKTADSDEYYKKAIGDAYRNGTKGGGGGSGTKAARQNAMDRAELMVEIGAVNPITKKPYTLKEAQNYNLGLLLKEKAPAPEWKLSDDRTTRNSADGSVVQDYDPKSNAWRTRGMPTISAAAAKAGVRADVSPSGQVGFTKDGKSWYTTEEEAYSQKDSNAPSVVAEEEKYVSPAEKVREKRKALSDSVTKFKEDLSELGSRPQQNLRAINNR